MKILFTMLIGCISFWSYGQEKTLQSIQIEWEQLSAPLSLNTKSSSEINKYKLLEVNLDIDLRKQYLRKDTSSMMILPENKYIQSDYYVAIPGPQNKNFSFTISGNGNSSSTNNSGGIKNTAYKDAGLYSGAFCPITGLAY